MMHHGARPIIQGRRAGRNGRAGQGRVEAHANVSEEGDGANPLWATVGEAVLVQTAPLP
jgi:hypothetical protein